MEFNFEKHKKNLMILMYIVTIGVIVFFFLQKILMILAPFIFAFILSYLLDPMITGLNKRLKINRKLSALILIVLFIAIFFFIISVLGSQLYNIASTLVTNFINNNGDISNKDGALFKISTEIEKIFGIKINFGETLRNTLSPIAQYTVSMTTRTAKLVPEFFIWFIVFVLATFFLSSDRRKLALTLKKYVRPNVYLKIIEIKEILLNSLLRYVKAQLTIMSITFLELFIGFTILRYLNLIHFNYYILIAILIAFIDAFPIFGTGTILIPWALYALLNFNFHLSLGLILIYAVCLTVRQLLEPKILGQNLGLHPLITLCSIYIGFQLMGIVGMIIFPIAALLVIKLNFFVKHGELEI